jgi:hypothetical protein
MLRYTLDGNTPMTVPDLLPAGHRPDYRRLEKVLTRSAIPDRVPFYELFIEDAMVERMTDEPLSPAAEVGLYYRLGHDYCNFPPDTGLQQTDCLEADDTGENNAAGLREWLDSDRGVVMSRRDLDRYRWLKVGDWCCERFTEYARHLRDGMKLVIRPWCRGVLAACMEGGGYALGTGNSPATYVRLENFYAMHEEGFAHGRYGGAP